MLSILRSTLNQSSFKVLACTFLALSLTACGGSSDEEDQAQTQTQTPPANSSSEGGTTIPSYTINTFSEGNLDSAETAFDAAYDFAMLNHYFTQSYSNTVASPDLFFDYNDGVSNIRTNENLTTGVMTTKMSRSSVDEAAYYEEPQQFGSPLRVYMEITLDVKSQLEFEDPLYVGVASSSTDDGWIVNVETTPSNIYKSEDYSRLLTAGDKATFRILQNKTASYGWWLESKEIDVISGLLESNTIAEDGTELSVNIKASERALTTSDEITYLVGDYNVKAGLQSSTIQGKKLQFKAPKITGLTTNVFIPFELKDYNIGLGRTCTLKSYSSRAEYDCEDGVRIKSHSKGLFASNKANALFNFEVGEATFPGNWPVLNSGKVTIKDNNGKTAVVTYSEDHISIEFNGSAITKTWDDVRESQ